MKKTATAIIMIAATVLSGAARAEISSQPGGQTDEYAVASVMTHIPAQLIDEHAIASAVTHVLTEAAKGAKERPAIFTGTGWREFLEAVDLSGAAKMDPAPAYSLVGPVAAGNDEDGSLVLRFPVDETVGGERPTRRTMTAMVRVAATGGNEVGVVQVVMSR